MSVASVAVVLLLWGGPARGESAGIRWERNYDNAVKKARSEKKPIMIDFWAKWCGWCDRLDKTTYVDPVVVKMAQDFVPVKVDTESGARATTIAIRYDVQTLPTIAFVSPSGRLIVRMPGFQGPGQFPKSLETAREMAQRVMGWEGDLDRNSKDPGALAGLGAHLFDVEAYDDSREMLMSAVKLDGERPSEERARSRLLVGIMLKHVNKFAEAEALLKEALAMRPPGEYEPKLLYVLGKTYMSAGRMDDARAALRKVISAHGESPIAQKAKETLVSLEQTAQSKKN